MNRFVALTLAIAAALGLSAAYLAQAPAGAAAPVESREAADARFTTVPPVRVLLGSESRRECRLRITGPYTVTAVGDFRVLAQGENLKEVAVSVASGGLRIAAREFPAWQLEFQMHVDGTLWVDGARYRGALRLLALPDGRFSAINVVPLEDYLASVLPSEMPADFPPAAQQAQVVAARSYALFQMKTYGRDNNFDVYQTARSQVYRGMQYTDEAGRELAVETPRSLALVEKTRGVALAYQGRLFCSYFSAVCGGHTTAGAAVFGQAAPPLVGVPCEHCSAAPNFRWQMAIPRDEFEAKLAAQPFAAQIGALQEITVNDPEGALLPKIELRGASGVHSMPAAFFRSHLLGSRLPSARFETKLADNELRVAGRGWGHGVGMCQWGAKQLAASGKSCEEILAYYYPGSELVHIE